MPADGPIDRAHVAALAKREEERFLADHPRCLDLWERGRAVMPNGVPTAWHTGSYHHPPLWAAEGAGARFRCADGRGFADFNVADMSMFCGYAPEPVVRAVADRTARGTQFLLPTEEAVWVAAELGRRWGLPKWQFTLSASQANTEAIRLARVATGRPRVLMFEGKYHGHFDDALVTLEDGRLVPEEGGLPPDVAARTKVVPFNDEGALGAALEPGDVALVLAEPAMTNNHGLLLPDPGFHDRLRALTREAGTLLCLDETHTLVCGPGGLVERWGLHPDLVSVGKSVAGGVPMGAYGMTETLADVLEQRPTEPSEGAVGGMVHLGLPEEAVGTGGTLFGNPLQMAAAKAALGEVLVEEAYERTVALGARLADGIQTAVDEAGMPWTAHRLFCRSGLTFAPAMARTAAEAARHEEPLLTRSLRIWLVNRGVWEAIPGAGPTVGVPAGEAEVDAYVEAFSGWVAAIAG